MTAPREAMAAALDAAYRERNRLVAALIRVGGYPAEVVMAPDTEGWFIVYAKTPAGQVSWHIGPDDMDLFRDWPVAFGSRPSPWDGHDTDEKYRRVAALEASGWVLRRGGPGLREALDNLLDVRSRRPTFATDYAFDSAMLEAAWLIIAALTREPRDG